MIRLSFVTGGSLRKVVVNRREITMISQEVGFTPVIMDLDKLKEKKIMKQMGEEGLKFMREISKLNTEEEMVKDIIIDFQKTGWRLVKKE